MRIEYLHSVGKEPPVILIYGNEPENATRLKNAVHALAQGQIECVAVHELPGFESVGGCELTFFTGSFDRGVVPVRNPGIFQCILRPICWDNIEGLIEPFCEPGPTAFNYLDYGFFSDVRLIISTDRSW